MLRILLFGIACASAAPRFPFSDESSLESMMSDDIMNMKSFWRQFNREMATLEDRIQAITKSIPQVATKEGIEGNQYTIEIPLNGFQESDISVKARKGLLKVEARHNFGPGSTTNYMVVRSLPDCVGENGDWTYDNGILKIVFPVNSTEATEIQTAEPSHSREEIETDNTDINTNADIGIDNSDSNVDIQTNEIPKAEGTTYSEGLKDDYEFVPLSRY
ncbi:unnamed protein product [Leptosia nina]|uniref:SHSP domain-containing protein n=1 Tax=Leptosia nina TaxID=320188 RepID=A0AAV1IW48_9NEOP